MDITSDFEHELSEITSSFGKLTIVVLYLRANANSFYLGRTVLGYLTFIDSKPQNYMFQEMR